MGLSQGATLKYLCDRAEATIGCLHEEAQWDPTTEKLIIRTSQDVQPILDANAELVNLGGDGFFGPERNWRRIASIPEVVIAKWLMEEGLNIARKEDWDYIVKKKLRDPEFSRFRTSPGKI